MSSSDDNVSAALNRLNIDDAAINSSVTNSQSMVNANPLCKLCGQRHRLSENHEYDYVEVNFASKRLVVKSFQCYYLNFLR